VNEEYLGELMCTADRTVVALMMIVVVVVVMVLQ